MTVQVGIAFLVDSATCSSPTCRREVKLKIELGEDGQWRWRDDNDSCPVKFRSIPESWRVEHGFELTDEQLAALLPRMKERLCEQLDGVEAALRTLFPEDEQE